MEKLAKNKAKFIGMSCLSISCLIGSFAYPLQKLEIYKQNEVGSFGIEIQRAFIITENDLNHPYGFDESRAIKVSHIYTDYKVQKILLLVLAVTCAFYANAIGYETCVNAEIDDEVVSIKSKAKKELILERIKHEFAMRSKAQRLLFIDEMKELIEQFGTPEAEIMEADELNAVGDEAEAEHQEIEPESVVEINEDIRKHFAENMDSIYWKAIQESQNEGVGKEQILSDVLDSPSAGQKDREMYYEFLVGKFGQ